MSRVPIREAARELWTLRATAGEAAFEHAIANLGVDTLRKLATCFQLYAFEPQLRPANGRPIWLFNAGRGSGKTRSASEDALDRAEDWGSDFRGILCSKTVGDVRDVMIQGESGLEACAERRKIAIRYVPSQSQVIFPKTGGRFHICSSEQPEKPRGYQSNYIWADEIAAWRNATTTWDNLIFGWRLRVPVGQPLIAVTTTPRPNPIMFRLMRDKALAQRIAVTSMRTIDNRANLAPAAVEAMLSMYEGTRLGQQELDGVLLETLGAIVEQDTIHDSRVDATPELARRVVALDPSITAKEDSDAAGLVVVGCDDRPHPHAYVLDDRTLEQATFGMWARAAVQAFVDWDCDCVVAEVNQGGGGIAEAIQVAADEFSIRLGREIVVPVRSVWARESKKARAEPIGALYERGRVHHVGVFKHLEKELTSWMPGMPSPNRMDALVHGVAHLLLGDLEQVGPIFSYAEGWANGL